MKFKDLVIENVKANDDELTIEGYASVFDNTDAYGDIVIKGAFENSLKKRKPLFLFNHNHNIVLGHLEAAAEDDVGLYFKAKFNKNVTESVEKYHLCKSGDLSGMSIGYLTVKEYWDKVKHVNILQEVDLYEISLVTFPANDLARVERVKSVEQFNQINNIVKSGFNELKQQLNKIVKALC